MSAKKNNSSFWAWFIYAVVCTLVIIVRFYTWKPIK